MSGSVAMHLIPAGVVLIAALVILPLLKRTVAATRVVLCLAVMALAAEYVVWRVTETMPPLDFTFASLWPWAYLLVELVSHTLLIVLLLTLTRTKSRSADATAQIPWVQSLAPPPLVDVLIPTYNEDWAVLEPTIAGVQGLDHPRLRIWVLDDSRRDWLREKCAERGVRYLTRPDNRHAKAGNLNNGLAVIARESEAPAFIAVFDADFVPHANFLQRTLGFFADAGIGLVQTPQHFYSDGPIQLNLNVSSWWLDEQRQHFDTILPSRDAWGSAYCCGTSYVIRYAGLLAIGGFPTESVTEDYLTTLKLNREGLRTVYLDERLSHGLAPAGMAEYVGQRARWCLGTMQIARSKWGPFSRGHMPLIYRLYILEHIGYWTTAAPVRLVFVLAPVVYWFTGILVIQTDLEHLALRFAPFYIGVNAVLAWLSAARILPILNDVNQILIAFDVARATVSGLLRPKDQKFRVTMKRAINDKIIVHSRLVGRFAAVLILYMLGVLTAALTDLGPSADDPMLPLAVTWSLINVTILMLSIFACVERPRQRGQERFVMNEPAMVEADGVRHLGLITQASVSGMMIETTFAAPVGTALRVTIEGVTLDAAVVVREQPGHGFAVTYQPTGSARDALIGKLFSGRYGFAPEEIGLKRTIAALFAWTKSQGRRVIRNGRAKRLSLRGTPK